MLFAHVNRDKKEWSFGVFYNSGVALSVGDVVVMDDTTPDGNKVTQAVANTINMVVGVAIEAVAATDYGRFQTYGYNSQVLVINDTSVALAAGDLLKGVASADYLAFAATGSVAAGNGFAYILESFATAATPAAALKKVFLRAL